MPSEAKSRVLGDAAEPEAPDEAEVPAVAGLAVAELAAGATSTSAAMPAMSERDQTLLRRFIGDPLVAASQTAGGERRIWLTEVNGGAGQLEVK
jgi:hypothetical protein